ncbi:MAG TPA: phosphoglycerate mutase family protein [Acidimicrobiales bacterium]
MPALLIRHAHAGSRKDWDDDDRLRPLSDKGRRQAAALARHLKLWTPKRVLSSPYVRCVESVEPYAKSLGLKVEEVDELAEGSGDAAMALIRRLPSYDVALCTHGDIISTVLACVVKEDRLDLGRSTPTAKGSTWVLERRGRRIQRANYREPPR